MRILFSPVSCPRQTLLVGKSLCWSHALLYRHLKPLPSSNVMDFSDYESMQSLLETMARSWSSARAISRARSSAVS